ncbi:MAG TPA: apolipoprotein N-acyltransferase [Nocardioides sp.]|nr:apolipoprotein N-acyltransferase [Nocardioides sp.]
MTSLPTRLGLACAAGLIAALSFEPFAWAPLLPLAVAGLTVAVRGARGRGAFGIGTAFGAVFMLVLLPWLRVIGTDAWIALSLLEALFYGVAGTATVLVLRLPAWPVWTATVWVGVEQLRSAVPFGGFPWGRLAFATADTPVADAMAYVGSAGTTFLVALLGTTLVWAADVRRRAPGRAVGAVLAVLALAVTPSAFSPNTPSPNADYDAIRVAAVQGNVPGEGMDAFAERRTVLNNHLEATRRLARQYADGAAPPDLVIWPESSTDIDPFSDPTVYADIQGVVDELGVPILVGAMVGGEDPGDVFNQGIVWHPGTGPGERYSKRHPVPFGEYIPLREQLAPYIERLDQIPRDMVPGDEPGVLEMNGIGFGLVICFEIAYDDVVREAAAEGTRVLVVQTNNATYMGTGQVEQQFAISRLRALETGRPVVVAATNGVTGVISPDGEVQRRAPVRSQTVVVDSVLGVVSRPPALDLALPVKAGLVTISVVSVLAGLGLGYRRRSRPEAPAPRPASLEA